MADRAPAIRQARAAGRGFVRTPAFAALARAGLVARGAVYAVIGVLALKLALGDGGATTNQAGALATIARQPFGKLLLVVVAVGLGGYVVWRLVRAVYGRGRERSDRWPRRAAGVAVAIAYGVVLATAVSILVGSGASSGSPDRATSGVLGWPGGVALVVAAGAIGIGIGIGQGWIAVTRGFLEGTKIDEMGDWPRRAFTALGVAGHVARMVVFTLVGYFLVRAALDHDPREAVSLDGALAAVAHAAYGPALLGVTAAGLVVFGAYSIVAARYAKV